MFLFTVFVACSEYEITSLTSSSLGAEKQMNNWEQETSALTENSDEYSDSTQIGTRADCENNQAPSFIDWFPQNDSILPQGETPMFEAWVHDPDGDPISVSWKDESGNTLYTTIADENGYAFYGGDVSISPGDFELSIVVEDGCEQQTSLLSLCQQDGYTQDELQLQQWHLEGDAEILPNGELELTGLDTFQLGSAFMTDSAVPANDIHIRFEFKTDGGTGADGISLTALDVSRMTSFLGGDGCGMGYGGGVSCTDSAGLPGWSIELDTWFNGEQPDPTSSDHVAVSFDGNIANPVTWTPVHELEETGWHTVDITVVAPRIRVIIDDYLYIDEDVEGNFDFLAYIGFTGSTGGQTNNHRIRGFTVEEKICDTGEIEEPVELLDPPEFTELPTDFEFEYFQDADWGSGYCGRIRVKNIGSTASVWQYPYAIDGTIRPDSWGCTHTISTDGSSWLFNGEHHNYSLEAGAETYFGFCADR